MTVVVTTVCVVLGLVVALLSAIRAARRRASSKIEFVLAALTEIGVLIYVVLRAVDLAHGHHVDSLALFIAYLAGIALVLPVAAFLSAIEPSRWGSIVLGSGALVACVLFARIHQLWSPHG